MLHKLIIAFAAVVAIATVGVPTTASARWHGGHGGWHGGWRGPGWGFYGYPYAYGPGPYYGGCYRVVRVQTPYGLRWRRVWVCG
jgi:hypothetical protein